MERSNAAPKNRPTIAPSKWQYWNVHIDGLEYIHDLIVEREGVFKECIEAIKMAKLLGYQVATNCTVYKETNMDEIEKMFDFLSALGVDGHTITPGYEYDAAKKDMIKRLNKQPEDFFLTRKLTREKFKKVGGFEAGFVAGRRRSARAKAAAASAYARAPQPAPAPARCLSARRRRPVASRRRKCRMPDGSQQSLRP